MSAKRICLFQAEATTDGNVDRIGREIIAGFAARGWIAEAVDISQGDAARSFQEAIGRLDPRDTNVLLSVESMGLMVGIEEIVAQTGARQLYWALDHPCSGLERLRRLPAGSVATFPAQANVECCRTYIRPDLALACAAHGTDPATAQPQPWEQRDIDILFIGNVDGPDPDDLRAQWRQFAAPWPQVLELMVEAWHAAPDTPPETLVRTILEKGGMSNADGRHFFQAQKMFDTWTRAWVRHTTIAALGALPLTLAGRGWDALAAPGHRVMGPVPASETASLMGRARMVLNILPDYYRSHERLYSAMAAGAATVTTGTGCLADALGLAHCPEDGTAIAAFGPMARRGEVLAALWASPDDVRRLGEAGRAEVLARHTWAHRVAGIEPLLGG